MSWIDEMILSIRSSNAAESTRTATEHSTVATVEASPKRISGAKEAWVDLLSILKKEVKEFNSNKARTGHSAVLMSSEALAIERFQFEVYLPEMQSKLLVLTLLGNSLIIEVRPGFPKQKAAITLEATKNGKGSGWMLGAADKEKELSTKELSEYLLEPILLSASID